VLEDAAGIGLAKVLAKFEPTNIICTHFLPAQLVGRVKAVSRVLGSRINHGLVITDLDLQSMWVQEGAVDAYYLPRADSEVVLREYEEQAREGRGGEGKGKTRKTKLSAVSRAVVSGIPIMPKFSHAADEAAKSTMFKLKSMEVFEVRGSEKQSDELKGVSEASTETVFLNSLVGILLSPRKAFGPRPISPNP